MISRSRMPEEVVRFVSKAEALEADAKRNPELDKQLPSNPLPDAFEITPKRGEDVELIAQDPDGARRPASRR